MVASLDRKQCARARLARDRRFDGLFFTAVKTTGIYCRPVCPAKPPKEENVTYFQTAAGAAEAGFRPCLRCRPESAPGTPVWLGTESTVSRALRLIHAGALNTGSVDDLADRLGITARYLRGLFARHLGASPLAFAQTQRFHFAKQLLNETDLPITQIALASGFGSIRRFNTVFKEAYGKPPRAYPRETEAKEATNPSGEHRLVLSYRPPYDWPAMLGFLRTRAIPNVERVGNDFYERSFRLGNCKGRLHIQHLADKHAFALTVRLDRIEALLEIVARVRRILDLDANVQAIQATQQSDPLLASLLERFPGTRLPGAWDPFEFAVRAVLGQQISVKAATTIAGRIAERIGPALSESEGGDGINRFFPTADEMAGADLSDLGLTRKRTETLAGLRTAIADGRVRLEVGHDLEHFIADLCALPGIGPWTAHYIAMRGLSEPDAFPEADLGIIKALSPPGERLSLKQLRARAEGWRPWRAYAAMLLWRSLAEPKPTHSKGA
ncbi:MAG: AlkA N-terminal domain-containing protein [Acidobacteriota bacterium]|nr:AlkA N-terminal domain-containing protein [Acidobacteriota bacterium]